MLLHYNGLPGVRAVLVWSQYWDSEGVMTKTMTWLGLVVACVGCSSATEQERCEGGKCSRTGASALTVDPNMPGGAEAPSGATDFGNAAQPTAAPPPPPAATTDGPMSMAGAGGPECEDGVFCPPSGPDGGCGQIRFDAEVEVTRHPGNVLLVFDRSASMGDNWQGQQRWRAAGDAIIRALEPLQADIAQAGAVFFPTPNGEGMPQCIDPTGIACIFVPLTTDGLSCNVDSADTSQIPFMAGDQFIPTFSTGDAGNAPPYFPVPNGFTPLMEGLQVAQMVLDNATLEGGTAVVVITDGEPNCMWNAGTANQIVTDWLNNQGISTHVIGLPGIGGGGRGPGPLGGGNGAEVLNALAQAGGTDQFITPEDPMALEEQLKSIVYETVSMGFNSCDIALKPAAEVPEKLLMIVEEPGVTEKKQVPRDFGWALNAAGDQVTISGKLCEEAQGGRFSSITFEYACPEAPPPEPIPPLQ